MGRKLIPKELRDFNYTKDQLIEALQEKDALQERLIASQNETIVELTRHLESLEKILRPIIENEQSERETQD